MNRRLRAEELGIISGELPSGPNNSLTDVAGVKVGHETIIRGEGKLYPGHGPVRTGVTAILPHDGNLFREKVRGAAYVLNGFGKSVGLVQIAELGTIETPLLLTNTLNVGLVSDALITYMLSQNPDIGITTGTVNPVVLECNDGYLNDIQGRHVKEEHVLRAIHKASSGRVEEGNVGAGTGMGAFGFKAGIGSASRRAGDFTVGALVMSNFGRSGYLMIAGVPVGRELKSQKRTDDGSIIVVLATDAPVSSRQLYRLLKRAAAGIARTGSLIDHGSGDIIIGFSTAYRIPHDGEHVDSTMKVLREDGRTLAPLFQAVVEATEEAIINSLLRSETLEGRDSHVLYALPIDKVVEAFEKYGRGLNRLA